MKGNVVNIYIPRREFGLIDKITEIAKRKKISRSTLVLEVLEVYAMDKGYTPETVEVFTPPEPTPKPSHELTDHMDEQLNKMLGL